MAVLLKTMSDQTDEGTVTHLVADDARLPETQGPDTARRYIQTFVLPAILEDPPRPRDVFGAN